MYSPNLETAHELSISIFKSVNVCVYSPGSNFQTMIQLKSCLFIFEVFTRHQKEIGNAYLHNFTSKYRYGVEYQES